MLKTSSWVAMVISSVLLAGAALAAVQDLPEELYIKSGMEKQIQQVPNLIGSDFEQALLQDKNLQKMNRGTMVAIKGLIRDAFAAGHLKKSIIREIEAGISQDAMQSVIDWLDSPLGQKCTRLEESAVTVEAMQAIQQFAMQLEKNPPSAQRLEQVQKLDQAIGATEHHINLTMNTQLAVTSAVVATLPQEKQVPLAHIKAQIEKARPQIAAAVQMHILVSFLYTYKPLTDTELDGYIAFANSKEGVMYHRATIAGFKKAILEASLKLGNSIGELLAQANEQEAI